MEVNLILLKKDGSTQSFTLPSAVSVLGRRQECDLCIPLSVVSRRHCELNMDQGQLKIRDLGSKNGTIVNGQRIEEARLNPGDKIKIGSLTLLVQIDGQPSDLNRPSKPAAPGVADAGKEKTDSETAAAVKSFEELIGGTSGLDSKMGQQQTHLYDSNQDMAFPGQNA